MVYETRIPMIYEHVTASNLKFATDDISSIDAEVASLTETETSLQLSLNHALHFLAPIRRLSEDILRSIFIHYVYSGDAPWTVISVSRLWRAVGTGTPRLWSSIEIVGNGWTPWGWKPRGKNQWVCKTAPSLERSLQWARAAPLDIFLNISEATSDSHEMVQIVAAQERKAQLQWLYVSHNMGSVLPTWQVPFHGRFPQLEGLTLLSEGYTLLEALRIDPPHNLRHIALSDGTELDRVSKHEWWRSIKTARFLHTLDSDMPPFLRILGSTPALEHLESQIWVGPLDSKLFKSTSMTQIDMNRSPQSLSGAFPYLTHLTVGGLYDPWPNTWVSTPSETTETKVSLPLLQLLNFSGHKFGLLAQIDAPRLEVLILLGRFGGFWNAEDDVSNAVSEVWSTKRVQKDANACALLRPSKHLHIHSLALSSTALNTVLKIAGRDVKELTLEKVYALKQRNTYDGLHLKEGGKKTKGLCQRLERLTLNCFYDRGWGGEQVDEEAVFGWMVGVGRNRREIGKPLESYSATLRTWFGGKPVDIGEMLDSESQTEWIWVAT